MMGTSEKRCSKCSVIYPATAKYFRRDKRTKSGLRSRCKKCMNKDYQDKYVPHPRVSHRKPKKSMTAIEKYNKVFAEQGGCCAICGEHQSKLKRRLDIDVGHNYETGEIESLLCYSCNRYLGRFKKGRDLWGFIRYLNKWVINQQ